MTHRDLALDSEADILDHLAGVDLEREDSLDSPCQSLDFLCRERPQGYRTEKAYLNALGTGDLNALLRYTGGRAESHDGVFGIVKHELLVADFLGLDLAVFSLDPQVDHLHFLGTELKGCDDIGLPASDPSGSGPRALLDDLFLGAAGLERRKHDFLHHLADSTISEDHDRIAVAECQSEGKIHEISHFLD